MKLEQNKHYRFIGFTADVPAIWRQKLMSYGVLPGATLQVIRVAPFGDPLQIRLFKTHLMLRKQDLAHLRFEEVTV